MERGKERPDDTALLVWRERHCVPYVNDLEGLAMRAQKALEASRGDTRVAQLFTLHAYRLRMNTTRPRLSCPLVVKRKLSDGEIELCWPVPPDDLPNRCVRCARSRRSLSSPSHQPSRGCPACERSKRQCGRVKAGGEDLSQGAEDSPVMWINEVDTQRPPPFIWLRRCVGGDLFADQSKAPSSCKLQCSR